LSAADEHARTAMDQAVAELRAAPHRRLLLDYDGTLVPLVARPELAHPPARLLAVLAQLGREPSMQVHVVSGRPRRDLERWLGHLPIGLHAEHGAWSRRPDGDWRRDARVPLDLEEELVDTAVAVVARTPGAFVEVKSAALAFHYRLVPPVLVERLLRDIRSKVMPVAPPELRWADGAKVVELRPRAIHKGLVAERIARAAPAGTKILAAGDDLTDEDMFSGLPDDAITVKIGHGPSRALVRVDTHAAFIDALVQLSGCPANE
jgi:trehalose 6-phosphate synthase/phosphatase